MECKPNPSQTSPDCWQIALMGEYGAAVYGSRGDDTGQHPVSAGAEYGTSHSPAGDAAVPLCASMMIAGAVILAAIMARAGVRRTR